jgi:hypothetical protein
MMVGKKPNRVRRAVVAVEYLLVASTITAGAAVGLGAIRSQFVADSQEFAQQMSQVHQAVRQPMQPQMQPQMQPLMQPQIARPMYAPPGYPGVPPYQQYPPYQYPQAYYSGEYDSRPIKAP